MLDKDKVYEYDGKYYKKEPKLFLRNCYGCAFISTACPTPGYKALSARCNNDEVIFVEIDPMLATILEVKEITEDE